MGLVLPVIVAVIGVWIAFSIVVWATGNNTLLDLAPAGAPPGLGDEEPVSEASIAAVKFDTGARGYRTDQVDAALTRLAWEIGRRDEQLAALRAELGAEEEKAEAEAEVLAAVDEDVDPAVDDADLEPAEAPFEEPLDEDTFRLAKDADRDGDGREAARDDDGEATPRSGS